LKKFVEASILVLLCGENILPADFSIWLWDLMVTHYHLVRLITLLGTTVFIEIVMLVGGSVMFYCNTMPLLTTADNDELSFLENV